MIKEGVVSTEKTPALTGGKADEIVQGEAVKKADHLKEADLALPDVPLDDKS